MLILALACYAGSYGDDEEEDFCADLYDVAYDLSTDPPTCCDPDDQSTYESGDARNISCAWYCDEYNGESNYVSLSFWDWGDGAGWVLDSEYVAECI